MPPNNINLTANRLPELLALHGTTPDIVTADARNDDTPDAYRLEAITRTEQKIPGRYREATPDNPLILDWANQAIAGARSAQRPGFRTQLTTGPSLLLLGITGVGKTWQSYGAIRYIAAGGVHSNWQAVALADLYALLRPRGSAVDPETEFRRYADATLLLLDDLGAAKPSEWVEEINYRIINHRYEENLPTLLTSNLTPTDLLHRVGERVYSRLCEMCDRAWLKGPDRRRLRMAA